METLRQKIEGLKSRCLMRKAGGGIQNMMAMNCIVAIFKYQKTEVLGLIIIVYMQINAQQASG